MYITFNLILSFILISQKNSKTIQTILLFGIFRIELQNIKGNNFQIPN